MSPEIKLAGLHGHKSLQTFLVGAITIVSNVLIVSKKIMMTA